MNNSNTHYQRNKERVAKEYQNIIIKKVVKKEQKNINNNEERLQEKADVDI